MTVMEPEPFQITDMRTDTLDNYAKRRARRRERVQQLVDARLDLYRAEQALRVAEITFFATRELAYASNPTAKDLHLFLLSDGTAAIQRLHAAKERVIVLETQGMEWEDV